MNKQLSSIFLFWLGALFLLTGTADGASFEIQPIKVFFNARTRTEKLTIRNVSDSDLSLQIAAFKWSQDKEGKDIYEETAEIVIFPRILKIPKGEEKLIRVGTTLGPALREGTYRVYVEELPVEDPQSEGVGLRITMKVGIPVFISPEKADGKAEVESLSMEKGKTAVRVKNTGNSHFIVTSLKVTGRNDQGAEIFSKDFGGWYLLSGVARTYETDIPYPACSKLAKIGVTIKTTRNSVQEELKVTRGMCGTPGR